MKKSWIFLFVFVIGTAVIALEIAVFRAGFAIIIAGILVAVAGAIGASFYSRRARKAFGWVVEVICDIFI